MVLDMKKINLPTKITISRIFLAFALIVSIIVLYLLDEFNVISIASIGNIKLTSDLNGPTINWIMIVIFLVFALASFTDFVDGYLARKNNEVTDLGKFLDPIADKMLVNSMMVFLALNFASLGSDVKFPFFCVIIMVIRDLVVDGLRFMAAQKQVVIAANMFGKVKTVTQMFAILVVLLNGFPFSYLDYNWPTYLHISDWLCYIATFFSVLSGVIYVKQNIHVLGGNQNE